MPLWTITSDMLMFSAYIKIDDEIKANQDLISEINIFLFKKYNIIESTIQVMPKTAIEACNI